MTGCLTASRSDTTRTQGMSRPFGSSPLWLCGQRSFDAVRMVGTTTRRAAGPPVPMAGRDWPGQARAARRAEGVCAVDAAGVVGATHLPSAFADLRAYAHRRRWSSWTRASRGPGTDAPSHPGSASAGTRFTRNPRKAVRRLGSLRIAQSLPRGTGGLAAANDGEIEVFLGHAGEGQRG